MSEDMLEGFDAVKRLEPPPTGPLPEITKAQNECVLKLLKLCLNKDVITPEDLENVIRISDDSVQWKFLVRYSGVTLGSVTTTIYTGLAHQYAPKIEVQHSLEDYTLGDNDYSPQL